VPETAGAGLLTAIGILLMVGACGKSAQIPLYVWLPDAMEGPTPVSALIHAATMVTAGVYMVSRSHTIFERGTGGPDGRRRDLERSPRCSLRRLASRRPTLKRFLLLHHFATRVHVHGLRRGSVLRGIFHLMTHAFFKGLLFLAAGSVIHAVGGEQDMRKMGGLRSYIPCTFITMGIATLAIAGIPPFAGFWSKDEILWKAYSSDHGSWVFWLVGRCHRVPHFFLHVPLLFMTFWGDYGGAQVDEHGHVHAAHGHDDHGHGEPHESPMVMLVPLMILALLQPSADWLASKPIRAFSCARVRFESRSQKQLEKRLAASRSSC